jgi:hypothetical protein
MATVEVEIGDDGRIGKLPDPLQRFLDDNINKAYGKGAAKAAEEAKGQVAKEVAAEIAKVKAAGDLGAAEREKLKTLEAEHSKALEDLAKERKDYAEAERIRNERHALELREREDKIKAAGDASEKRLIRVRELVAKEIAAIAASSGARKESLPELEVLLGGRIGLDDALQPFVKDDKDAGKPALDTEGKPLSIEGFVQQYLADHPHHKAATSGRGGGANGGRSFNGGTGGDSLSNALAAAAENPNPKNQRAAWSEINKRVAAS